jgi:hypothetical protein
MVKCHDCGLLATRNNDTGQWEEVDQRQRTTGQGQIRGDDAGYPREATWQFSRPVCILQVFDLASEYTQESSKSDSPINSAIALMLQRERDCESFTKWQIGFSPKEHREMIDREWMRKYQEEHEKTDKEWREKQDIPEKSGYDIFFWRL